MLPFEGIFLCHSKTNLFIWLDSYSNLLYFKHILKNPEELRQELEKQLEAWKIRNPLEVGDMFN